MKAPEGKIYEGRDLRPSVKDVEADPKLLPENGQRSKRALPSNGTGTGRAHPRSRRRRTTIDHTGVTVGDFEASRRFYATALAPPGYELLHEFDAPVADVGSVAGFGETGKPDFWIARSEANTPWIHVAFRAETRQKVDAFYEAALKAGGRDNGAPWLRTRYHPDYYEAFVLDPDGHNIEAVCHTP